MHSRSQGTAGSNHYGHVLHKRQADQRCGLVALTEICSSGFTRDISIHLLQCGLTEAAVLGQLQCQLNSMGVPCASFDTDLHSQAIAMGCSSPTNCTSECRDLLNTTRNQLGCCVNIFNDSASGSLYDPSLFRNSLWSLCGVEPVTEECEPSFELPQVELDPTCNSENFFQSIFPNVLCRRSYVELTRDVLADEGCENNDIFDQLLENCLANEDGQYCSITYQIHSYLFEKQATTVTTLACVTHSA